MTITAPLKHLGFTSDRLNIEWADGTTSEFASLWLRDNLREDRDAHSGQRLIDVADLPEHPRIRNAAAYNGSVNVEWEGEQRPASFELGWLREHSSVGRRPFAPRLWLEAAGLTAAKDFAWPEFSAMNGDRAARTEWLTRLLRDGLAFLSKVPRSDAGILEAARLTGRVAETNYGLVFEVKSVAQPENLAFSDLGLGLHTDNPYREPVPGFQMLHVLSASPDGGESLYGDGFAIAEHLRSTEPDAFAVLTQTAVPFLYRSNNAELYAERPLIQLSLSDEVSAVHYNSRSIAPLRLGAREAERFYSAYRRFASVLRDPRFQLRFMLRDGDLAVFDNQRILHGRTAFSSSRYPRHLRGCYLTRDSVYSEAALLRREFPSDAPS
jgi:alpha-ketoglutarate-dependent taurine dioxygenase